MTRSPTIRRPTPADLAGVGALLRARDIARVGVAELTDAELAHDWSTPGFALASDAWLAEVDDALVGYADVFPDEPGSFFVETVTAPGQGALEPELLRLVHGRAAELGALALRAILVDAEVEVERVRVYESHGYRRVRTFLRMRLGADDPAPRRAWPADVEPGPFDPAEHARQVYDVLRAAFEDHYAAARPGDYAQWRHDTLEHPAFDAGCWALAWEGRRLVGAVVALPEEGGGWVKTIGVLPEARGRGVGEALLAEAIHRLRDKGPSPVELGVDAENTTGATRLYERAGMHVVRRTHIFEKILR